MDIIWEILCGAYQGRVCVSSHPLPFEPYTLHYLCEARFAKQLADAYGRCSCWQVTSITYAVEARSLEDGRLRTCVDKRQGLVLLKFGFPRGPIIFKICLKFSLARTP